MYMLIVRSTGENEQPLRRRIRDAIRTCVLEASGHRATRPLLAPLVKVMLSFGRAPHALSVRKLT